MGLDRTTLLGTHVALEPLSSGHVDALVGAATADRTTFGFTGVPGDHPAMQQYVDGLLHDADEGTALPFAQRRLADGLVIGCTRFMSIVSWPIRPFPVEVEIGGTWLATDAQRSAINTEAKLLLLGHAFDHWGVHRVALCTDARNERSRRAIERLGAVFEGVLRQHRVSMGDAVESGRPRDSAVYSIVYGEWPVVRERLEARLRAR